MSYPEMPEDANAKRHIPGIDKIQTCIGNNGKNSVFVSLGVVRALVKMVSAKVERVIYLDAFFCNNVSIFDDLNVTYVIPDGFGLVIFNSEVLKFYMEGQFFDLVAVLQSDAVFGISFKDYHLTCLDFISSKKPILDFKAGAGAPESTCKNEDTAGVYQQEPGQANQSAKCHKSRCQKSH